MLDYLDVDNFIDYILVNAYAAVADWPDNNWVAARERSDEGTMALSTCGMRS